MIHFLVISAVLLYLHSFIWPEDAVPDSTVVRVTQQDLVQLLQSQSGVSDQTRLEQAFAAMPQDKKTQLAQRFFEQEALYREALAMGLDQNDPAVRRRLIQRISLMADQIGTAEQPSRATLQQYFETHQAKYAIDASITLTHVFLADTSAAGYAKAEKLLNRLQTEQISFEQASQYGERFLYHANYVQRTPEFIQVHFDQAFSDAVFSPDSPLLTWLGPIESQHGLHLVMIKQRSVARAATFQEVAGPVLNDYRRDQQVKVRQENLRELIADYRVELEDGLNLDAAVIEPQ